MTDEQFALAGFAEFNRVSLTDEGFYWIQVVNSNTNRLADVMIITLGG